MITRVLLKECREKYGKTEGTEIDEVCPDCDTKLQYRSGGFYTEHSLNSEECIFCPKCGTVWME